MRISARASIFGAGTRGAAPAPSGTPFDISTTTTPITSKVITNPDSFDGLTFGDSGSKAYIANSDGNIYQYTVSTPYDITTLIDTPTSFDVSVQETFPACVEFKPDGTRMYICGNSQYYTQYTLSTPWSVTSAGSPVQGIQEYSASWRTGGFHFNAAGDKIYEVFHDFGATCYLNSESLGTPWDISTISGNSTYVNISANTGQGTGIHLSDDGTLLHVSSNKLGGGEDFVLQYLLSTPFDETSGTLDFTYDSSVLDGAVDDITFDNTGYKMYIIGSQTNTVYQIPLTG